MRRILPGAIALLIATVVLSWAWSRGTALQLQEVTHTDAAATATPTLPPAPSLTPLTPATTSEPIASPSSPTPGLPGDPGVMATPWPGADAHGVITWGPGEFTVAPPVYPPATAPPAAPSCPWDATDAAWAQSAMTADASDDLETENLLLSGRGFTIPGWGQDSETTGNIETYEQAQHNWSQIATWINDACFPVAATTAITVPEAAQAVTWLQAGAASHPGSDSWSVSWRDAYDFTTQMFEELTS
jgi:hypothetical protein